mgnify:CR=1 FL=1
MHSIAKPPAIVNANGELGVNPVLLNGPGEPPGPWHHCDPEHRSAHQDESLRFGERPRAQAVEVHTAWQPLRIEPDLVIAGILFPIMQNSDLLPQGVEHCQRHVYALRKPVSYRCRGIERVREILQQLGGRRLLE